MKARKLESLNADLFHPLSTEQTKKLVGGDSSTNPTSSKTMRGDGPDTAGDYEVEFKGSGPGVILRPLSL